MKPLRPLFRRRGFRASVGIWGAPVLPRPNWPYEPREWVESGHLDTMRVNHIYIFMSHWE